MTWTVTLGSGARDAVLPNGLRYQASARVILSDRWYGQLSAAAAGALASSSFLGGIVSYTVTLADGLSGVVLPDGLSHEGGEVVVLSDEDYSVLSPAAVSSFFSSVTEGVT